MVESCLASLNRIGLNLGLPGPAGDMAQHNAELSMAQILQLNQHERCGNLQDGVCRFIKSQNKLRQSQSRKAHESVPQRPPPHRWSRSRYFLLFTAPCTPKFVTDLFLVILLVGDVCCIMLCCTVYLLACINYSNRF